MITVKIADLPIGIDNKFSYLLTLAEEYACDCEPVFTVSVSSDEIEREREQCETVSSDGYLESIVAYRKIAELLPKYGAFVFHGAVLNVDGRAYAFTARSGVGKTTHTRLWLSEFGTRVHYLNGDKPVIRFIDGVPYAFGTPWRGKEGYGVNESAQLMGIALLERASENSADVIDARDGVMRLIGQIYLPKNPESAVLTMRLADELLKKVKFVELRCNMEREAAHVAYRALTCD